MLIFLWTHVCIGIRFFFSLICFSKNVRCVTKPDQFELSETAGRTKAISAITGHVVIILLMSGPRIRGISVVCICWQTNDRPDREAGFYTLPHPTLHYICSLKGEWFHIEWIYYIFLPKVSGNPQIFSVTVSYSWPDGNYRLLWGVSCSSNKEKKSFFSTVHQ